MEKEQANRVAAAAADLEASHAAVVSAGVRIEEGEDVDASEVVTQWQERREDLGRAFNDLPERADG